LRSGRRREDSFLLRNLLSSGFLRFALNGPGGGNYNHFKLAARGIQLDPRTRSGWTYGPLDAQVQELTY
jgi:hypothetical protein